MKLKKIVAVFLVCLLLVTPFGEARALPPICKDIQYNFYKRPKVSSHAKQPTKAVLPFKPPKKLGLFAHTTTRFTQGIKAKVLPAYRRQAQSPLHSLLQASADYYDVMEIKRRSGNVKIPFLPLVAGVWSKLDKPVTADMLQRQTQDTNVDTNLYESMENRRVVETMLRDQENDSNTALRSTLKKYFKLISETTPTYNFHISKEGEPVLSATVGRRESDSSTVSSTPSLIPIEGIYSPFEFNQLSAKEKELLSQQLVTMTQINESQELNTKSFESTAQKFYQQTVNDRFTNLTEQALTLFNANPRNEKEQAIKEAELQELFRGVFNINDPSTPDDQQQFLLTPSYVAKIGSDLATAKFLKQMIIQDTNKIYKRRLVLDTIKKARDLTQNRKQAIDPKIKDTVLADEIVTERMVTSLQEILRENSAFAIDFLGISPAQTKRFNKENVKENLTSGQFRKLSQLQVARLEALEIQRKELNSLIQNLTNLQIASQQVSFGGSIMVKDRLKSIKKLGADTTFHNTELSSIQLLLGLTSPISLGSDGHGTLGVIQEYISSLSNSIVDDWLKQAPVEQSRFFKNPFVEKAARLYFENICIKNYGRFLENTKQLGP